MIKDGIDVRPLRACVAPCRDCGRTCKQADIDAALRADGWHPIEEAPVGGTGFRGGKWLISAKPVEVECLTNGGNVMLCSYRADGDYNDRWMTRGGAVVHVTHWRAPNG